MIEPQQVNKNIVWLELLALLILLITAFTSLGYYHADEHYQIIEWANCMNNPQECGYLMWEYDAKIRPVLQPVIAYGAIKIFGFFGSDNPFHITLFLRIITATWSWFLITGMYRQLRTEFNGKFVGLFMIISFLLWFQFYIGVRFSSETWGALAFFSGVLVFLKKFTNWNALLAGLLFGLAFHFRYQVAFFVLGFFLWLVFVQKTNRRLVVNLVIGGAITFMIGVVIDSLFYEEFTVAGYNYFKVNLLDNKVEKFGVSKWYQYVIDPYNRNYYILGTWLLASYVGMLVFLRRHWITWVLIPFLLVHQLIGHKELRFLFPIVFVLPFIFTMLVQKLVELGKKTTLIKRIALALFLLPNSIYLFYTMTSSEVPGIAVRKLFYDNYTDSDIIIFYYKSHPFYTSNTNPRFYQQNSKNKYQFIEIDDLGNLPESRAPNTYLYVADRKGVRVNQRLNERFELVYQNVPEFTVAYFNLFGVMNRTTYYSLYKL